MARSFLPFSGTLAPADYSNIFCPTRGVHSIAVLGLPDPKWGEAVTAVIAPLPGQELTEQEIIEHCRKNLAGYKCPKTVKFMEMLPKNTAGKILKRELREIYKQT
jgi:acyl-CoA synthetase (AMP-forming)/AMP-acid ligase II